MWRRSGIMRAQILSKILENAREGEELVPSQIFFKILRGFLAVCCCFFKFLGHSYLTTPPNGCYLSIGEKRKL